ncbi:MAG TPA: hypothetical protein VNQ79_05720 [Blastocatellia bacterium]|nr:hypothetical protein [Blastocatellia bacterium]
MSRTDARAPRGLRAEVSEPFNPGMKQSVIGALGLEGPLPALVVDGASNREVFNLCVEFFLVPQLQPGSWC